MRVSDAVMNWRIAMGRCNMATVFDVVTVTCFAALVLAFFFFTSREPKRLLHLIVPGVVFAIANQVGNAGLALLAVGLITAGAAYAALVVLAR
jgi:hypothetical protein